MLRQLMKLTLRRRGTLIRSVHAILFSGALTTIIYAQQADNQGLPKAEDLLDKHVEVTGGKKAYLALKSRMISGKLAVRVGGHKFTCTIEKHYLAPDKSHSLIESDLVMQVTVCDGKEAWVWGSGGASGVTGLLEGVEKARAIEKAKFNAVVMWRDQLTTVKTLGVVTVNDNPAYEVRLVTKSGEQYSRFYDKSSGRLVKQSRKSSSYQGIPMDLGIESFFEDYREFDGVWLPTTIRELLSSPLIGKGTQVWNYSEIQHNKKITPTLFKMPEEVQVQLQKAKKAKKEEKEEGGEGVSVAYLLKHPERFHGRTVVPVVCGKNIGTELFKKIINRRAEPVLSGAMEAVSDDRPK